MCLATLLAHIYTFTANINLKSLLASPSYLSSHLYTWRFICSICFLACRVGDGPIAGSSAYADTEVGACGASGDGDIMMRFLPWYGILSYLYLPSPLGDRLC